MAEDSVGSIRIPAAFNNVFGLRPTMGLTSRSGVMLGDTSLDIIGPQAKSMSDIAVMLDYMVGHDPKDPVTQSSQGNIPKSYTESLEANQVGKVVSGARIAVINSLFGQSRKAKNIGANIKNIIVEQYKSLGAEIVEYDELPVTHLSISFVNTMLASYEVKRGLNSYLANTPNAPVKTLREIRRSKGIIPFTRFQLWLSSALNGTKIPFDRWWLRNAMNYRQRIIHFMETENIDAIAYPIITSEPMDIAGGYTTATLRGLEINAGYSAATGLPALNIPAGLSNNSLPIAFDLLGKPWSEPTLISLGYAFEKSFNPRITPPTTPPLQ